MLETERVIYNKSATRVIRLYEGGEKLIYLQTLEETGHVLNAE